MKQIIISIFVLICSSIVSFAQEDYLQLNNGSIIKGKIENVVENQSVTIKSTNGQTYTYPMIEINHINYGQPPKTPNQKSTSNYKEYSTFDQGFWGAIEFQGGYSCNFTKSNAPMLELDAVGGYRFNQFIRLGIGIGSRYYINSDKLRTSSIEWSFPIYANIRGNIIPDEDRTIVPYYSFDIGGAIRDGFLIRPTIGVRIGQPRSAFLLGLSYLGQSLKCFDINKDGNPTIKRKLTSFVTIKIGYEF